MNTLRRTLPMYQEMNSLLENFFNPQPEDQFKYHFVLFHTNRQLNAILISFQTTQKSFIER